MSTKFHAISTPEGGFAATPDLQAVSAVKAATGGAEDTLDVSGYKVMRLAPEVDVWLEADATAAVPSADATSGASVYYPAGGVYFIDVAAVQTLHSITESAGNISIQLWT